MRKVTLSPDHRQCTALSAIPCRSMQFDFPDTTTCRKLEPDVVGVRDPARGCGIARCRKCPCSSDCWNRRNMNSRARAKESSSLESAGCPRCHTRSSQRCCLLSGSLTIVSVFEAVVIVMCRPVVRKDSMSRARNSRAQECC